MAILIAVDQTCYRFRNDDGSETSATWAAALNTTVSQAQNANFRLRIGTTSSTGSGWLNTSTVEFEYNRNSAGWNVITSSSSVVQLSPSTHVTDETTTTQQIITGTFAPSGGNVLTSSTLSTNGVGGSPDVNEFEFCGQILSGSTTAGDTIQFRVAQSGGTAPTTTTQTPSLTVTAGAVSARRRSFIYID
jgi:hypothetical protein